MMSLGLGGILLILFVGWVTLALSGLLLRCFGRVIPLLLLVGAGFVGGLTVSGNDMHAADSKVWVDHDMVPDDYTKQPTPEIPARPWHFGERVEPSHGSWMRVALVAMLIIGGSLLFNRRRPDSIPHKLLTVVGLAAVGFLVATFVRMPSESIVHDSDRVVRVVASAKERPANAEQVHTAKRPTRAKRPVRPAAPAATSAELPTRAGEIPVSAELAKSAPAPTTAPDPVAALAAGAVDVAANPSAEPSTPSDAKPAEPASVTPAKPAEEKPSESPPPEAKPADTARLGTPRPEWVESEGKLVDLVYRMSVKSGLYVDVPECQRALDEAIKRAADNYIDRYVCEGAATRVDISRAYLREHVKRAEYDEVVVVSLGPMHQIHALLEFDDNARVEFYNRWRNAVVTDRLWYAGSAAALVLALLGTFYSYLRLDLRTGGAHQGRLRLAATLVALIAVASVLLVQWAD